MSTELAAIPASLMRFNQAMVNVYNFDIPEDQSISKEASNA